MNGPKPFTIEGALTEDYDEGSVLYLDKAPLGYAVIRAAGLVLYFEDPPGSHKFTYPLEGKRVRITGTVEILEES